MRRSGSREAVDLWVRDEGEGLPVVLLHGFTGSGDSMSDLVSPTTNRVIAPDLIGHGLSPAPDQLGVYKMEAMVGQLDGCLSSVRFRFCLKSATNHVEVVFPSLQPLKPIEPAGDNPQSIRPDGMHQLELE